VGSYRGFMSRSVGPQALTGHFVVTNVPACAQDTTGKLLHILLFMSQKP
jgi:hypothetical protein